MPRNPVAGAPKTPGMLDLPDTETCCWLAALAFAGGLEVRAAYWLTRAGEAWWPGVGLDV